MLLNYLKIAWKVLLRRKFYTAVSLFGIAFTLTVLTVCAAFVDAMFAPRAPETRLDRILSIEWANLHGPQNSATSNPGFKLLDTYARDLDGVEALSITSTASVVASYVDGRKIETTLRRTDAAFWEIMEFAFVEGGPLTAGDVDAGSFVAVLNASTRDLLLGDGPAVGRTVRLGGRAHRVVGVVRDVSPTRTLSYAEAWVPITTTPETGFRDELLGGCVGILLARDRSAFDGIRSEFQSRLAAAELPEPDRYEELRSFAGSRAEQVAREILGGNDDEGRAPTGRLALTAGVLALAFMALPALNLVNLNLSRILERSSEIGVRKAFGGSSRALVGQFLTESVVLTLIGGLIGVALSAAALSAINASGAIPYADFAINVRVFGWGLLLSLVFGLLSGAIPAWRMSRVHPVRALSGRTR